MLADNIKTKDIQKCCNIVEQKMGQVCWIDDSDSHTCPAALSIGLSAFVVASLLVKVGA